MAANAESNVVLLLLGTGGLTALATVAAQILTGRRTGEQSARELQARQWVEIVEASQHAQDECLRREAALRSEVDGLRRRVVHLEESERAREVDRDREEGRHL